MDKQVFIRGCVPTDISAPLALRPDPIPANEGEEYEVECILQQKKRGKVFQFLTLLKDSLIHDAKWQSARDFIDKAGTMNGTLYKYIKSNDILRYFWEDINNVVEVDNKGEAGIV